MNIAVRYHSRGGNTKKVAEALGTRAENCSVTIPEAVDLLFLGGSVYGFGMDDAIKNFIAQLNPRDVKAVALFGTSAVVKTGNQEMAKLLRDKGIVVLDQDFYCRGSFTIMHRGHPDAADLRDAAEFARSAACA